MVPLHPSDSSGVKRGLSDSLWYLGTDACASSSCCASCRALRLLVHLLSCLLSCRCEFEFEFECDRPPQLTSRSCSLPPACYLPPVPACYLPPVRYGRKLWQKRQCRLGTDNAQQAHIVMVQY